MAEMAEIVMCSVCSKFETRDDDGPLQVRRYPYSDAAVSVLLCGECGRDLDAVMEGAVTKPFVTDAARALHLMKLHKVVDPVAGSIEAMVEIERTREKRDRRSILTVLDGGKARDGSDEPSKS